MNKIINWVGGSFFRTIGRLLVYILLGYILALLLSEKNIKLPIFQVLDVHANTVTPTYVNNGFDNYTGVRVYNWTSSSNYTMLDNTSIETMTNYQELIQDSNNAVYQNRFYAINNSNVTSFGSNGISITAVLGNTSLITNSYYSTTAYLCYQTNNDVQFREVYTGTTYANSFNNPASYSKQTLSNLIANTTFLFTENNHLNYCRAISFIFTPSSDGQILNIRLTSNGSIGTWVFVGTKTEFIGDAGNITQAQVQSAINNSGLASANSVAAVQSSVNQVKQEIQGTQDAIDQQTQQQQANHEETIDTITDDSINENGVSDFTSGLNKEYSSLTPFSDFLNLPLTWIQSLFASGQSCTTIHLPLPYLNNKNLDLPCMTSFWQQMGAIGTLVQVVWIAIVGVRIFNGLFLLTCETIDPNPDKDMTKLRTWEL